MKNKEIERKFLVSKDWKELSLLPCEYYKQGYIYNNGTVVRVRVAEDKAFLTIKGEGKEIRSEFEYEIPLDDANEMLSQFCDKVIEKKRHISTFGGRFWEVDEFLGENEGLILAEIELEGLDEEIEIPDWATEEVTRDGRYYNSYLINNPYKKW